VTAADHPLARRKAIDFAETLEDNFVSLPTSSAIHSFISDSADRFGARLKLRIQVGNFEAACRMIHAGVGVGVVPESVALRHAEMLKIAIIPLTDAWAERRLKICVRSLQALPAFGRELVERLLQPEA
jgi:DNA-binding transcriptional LysR family regulator